MKAVLLAAGLGARLRPLTDKLPKPLLPIAGSTLIERHVSRLKSAGITEIVINLHYLGEMIEAQLGDGSRQGVTIEYSWEPELLETGGGIKRVLPLLGQDPFAVISADTYTDFDFARLGALPIEDCEGCLVMVDNPVHHPAGDFSLEDRRLGLRGTCLTWSSVSVMTADLINRSGKSAFMLREVFDSSVAEGRLNGIKHTGYWCDVGTAQRYEELKKHLSSLKADQ